MSLPDYSQKLADHQSFLVLIKPVGRRINPADYGEVYNKIEAIQRVRIPSDSRYLSMRYKHVYTLEDCNWGDFQFHRRVLGLICIAQYHVDNPLQEVEAHYNSVKALYHSSLFDSRLILLGVAGDEALLNPSTASATPVEESELQLKADHFAKPKDTNEDVKQELQHEELGRGNECTIPLPGEGSGQPQQAVDTAASRTTQRPLSDVTLKQLLCFESAKACLESVEDDVREFACSLFYILESKRIGSSRFQVDRQPQLLMAPFERDIIHIDTESKVFKKRYIGRQKKHVGDLCLLAGMYSEAASNYHMALDILKSADDWLWVAGTLEGLCCASVIIYYPATFEKVAVLSLPRYRSFSTKRGLAAQQNVNTKPPGPATGADSGSLDLAGPRAKNLFQADEIAERYREAILQYSKFRPAAVAVELEACIKVSRVLIMQGKRWEACEFLQHIASMNLESCHEEKIMRFSVLADLYKDIGFLRKAAFYKRSAALECVTSYPTAVPSPPRATWQQCHSMLQQTFPGYRLSLNVKDYDVAAMVGWPVIRHRVLNELTRSAIEIADRTAAVRYLCITMHCLFEHVTKAQLKDLSSLIETYSSGETDSEAEKGSRRNASQASLSIAEQPVQFSFTKFPILCDIKIEKLPPHMAPIMQQKDADVSVFIYTPLDKGRNKRKTKGAPNDTGVSWVEGDFSEVELHMYNPMPYELKLTDIGLITEGMQFESHPSGHTLPAESGPHLIKVVGTPKSSGTLLIKGYTCRMLGVHSSCLFADLARLKGASDGYAVDVSPSLPLLKVSECSGLPRSPYLVTGGNSELHTSAILRLFYGERKECVIHMRNVGSQSVETLELSIDSKLKAITSQVLQWNSADIASQLPLAPGSEAFLVLVASGEAVDPSDLPVLAIVPMSPGLSPDRQPGTARERTDSRTTSLLVECTLKIKYSGGMGMVSLYHRQCAMAIDLVLDPAIDIVSSEIVSHSAMEFKLTLTLINRSNVTLDLQCNHSSDVVGLKPMATHVATFTAPKCDSCASDDEVVECARHAVDALWMSPTVSGRVPTAHLSWSPVQLSAARRSAVLMGMGFAGVAMCDGEIDSGRLPCFNVGEVVIISIQLHNQSRCDLEGLHMLVDVCQSTAPFHKSSAVDDGFCTIVDEPSCRLLPVFASGSSHTSFVTVVTFYPGTYFLQALCWSGDDSAASQCATLGFIIIEEPVG